MVRLLARRRTAECFGLAFQLVKARTFLYHLIAQPQELRPSFLNGSVRGAEILLRVRCHRPRAWQPGVSGASTTPRLRGHPNEHGHQQDRADRQSSN